MVVKTGAHASLTPFGIAMTVLVLLLAIVFQILHFIKSNNVDYHALLENYNAMKKVADSLSALCVRRSKRYIRFIEENKKTPGLAPFTDIHDPMESINNILDEISAFFADSLSIRRNQVSANLAYCVADNKIWTWADSNGAEDPALTALIGDEQSAIYQICSGRQNFLFHADKIKANKKLEYIFNKKDLEHNNIGSIICAKVVCGRHNREYLFAVLCISTYGKRIINDLNNEKQVKEFIKDQILEQYFERIRMELALTYAKYLADHQGTDV
ncbi:MAG TPA: hypothetical protein VN366_05655 [Feifaniaceae bacterium]|nr:hypothetical protein [Feifaniaceae bacterium]